MRPAVTAPHIVGIGGTIRTRSTTESSLRFALGICQQEGATTVCFGGADLVALPHYAPDASTRTEGAVRLIEELRRADGVIVASPSYHGGVSGVVKNMLDYVEDLRGDARAYLAGLPVGCIATGAGWQAIVTTLTGLRSIAHALRGWPTPLGAAINTSVVSFDDAGGCSDPASVFQLTTVAQEVIGFARRGPPSGG